jgi:hypothetical protein
MKRFSIAACQNIIMTVSFVTNAVQHQSYSFTKWSIFMGYIQQEMPLWDVTTLSWTSVNKYLHTVSTVQVPLTNSNKQLTPVCMSLEYDGGRQTLWHIPYNLAVCMAFNNFRGESDRTQKLRIHTLLVTCTGTVSNSMHSQCSLLSCK